MFFTAVYNISSTTVKYDVLPGALADRYMRPYFVQDYRIFAPDPVDTDRQLWVRAWVELPDGERVTSEWINASAVELATPYRRILRKQLSVVGAERLMGAYRGLNQTHREVVAANHLNGTELYPLHEALVAADDTSASAVNRFIQAANFVTSYATQVSYAMWGSEGEIIAVQSRAVYDPVVRWRNRHDTDAVRPASTYTELGWVPAMEWPEQDREAFSRSFRAWADAAGIAVELNVADELRPTRNEQQ